MSKVLHKRKAFYVISTFKKTQKNIFKIGIHTGDIYSLLSRYITYFPNPIIHYFQYLDKEADEVENKLKLKLYDNRIDNLHGNKTEWVNLNYNILYKSMKQIIVSNKGIIIDKYANINPVIKSKRKKGRKCQNIKTKKKYDITFQDLVDIDESEYDFDELCNSIKLTGDQYIAHRKYMLLNKIGVCEYEDNEEFISLAEKFFNKEQHIDRFENLFELSNHGISDDEKRRIEIVKDFVKIIFGFDEFTMNDIMDVEISNKKYLKIIKNMKKKSIYFLNEEECHGLFFKGKIKFQTDNNVRYMAIIKTIMDMYGVCFGCHKRSRTNGKREYSYLLTINTELYDLMQRKHEFDN